MISDQKPPEYTMEKAIFYGQEFIVSPDILIPRIETEEIINMVPEPKIIADVGCGCGCIGITLAKKFPDATVYLSDISEAALKIARRNSKKETIITSDLLSHYPKNLYFDAIVANLPYIPTDRINKLPGSVKNFEPHLALDGGPNGTTLINKLLSQLPKHLKPGGLAILEIDDTHTLKDFKIPKNFKAKIKKDQFGRNRFLTVH